MVQSVILDDKFLVQHHDTLAGYSTDGNEILFLSKRALQCCLDLDRTEQVVIEDVNFSSGWGFSRIDFSVPVKKITRLSKFIKRLIVVNDEPAPTINLDTLSNLRVVDLMVSSVDLDVMFPVVDNEPLKELYISGFNNKTLEVKGSKFPNSKSITLVQSTLEQSPIIPDCCGYLNYDGNEQLHHIPNLPDGLHTLYIDCTQLDKIPTLPESVDSFSYQDTELDNEWLIFHRERYPQLFSN